MYGAMLPDMFNLMFDAPYQDYLWNETHYEFMKVVDLGAAPGSHVPHRRDQLRGWRL